MLHGGDIYGSDGQKINNILDFSANISPLGMPEKVWQAVIASMEAATHYPDPDSRALRLALVEKYNDFFRANEKNINHNFSHNKGNLENFLCGNGAADLIYRLIYAVRPKRALVIHPTFVEYEEAMAVVGTEIVSYDLNHEDFEIHEDILEKITDATDMIFICNPNNPTGVLTKRSLLAKILDKAKSHKCLLVIDECFLDFTGQVREAAYTMLPYIKGYDNLLILKSFTKMFAMPGIRLGYAISGNRALLEKMKHAGQSWPVSTMATVAGIAALAEENYVQQVVAYVDTERVYLQSVLDDCGLRWVAGHANYILFYAPQFPHLELELAKYDIRIRTCDNYKNLDANWYRIAVNGHEANMKLAAALRCIATELMKATTPLIMKNREEEQP